MHSLVKGGSLRFKKTISVISRLGTAAALVALAACGGGSTHPLLSLSGTISNLSGAGLVLANGSRTLPVSTGATSFTFGAVLSAGTSYGVTVQTQPANQTCSVANGTGTTGSANVANVVVTCANKAFQLGGSVSGLTTSGLVLANGSDTVTVPANATTFAFPSSVASGSSYNVTVQTQPTGLACAVADGNSTMPASAVTTVAVTCTDQPFTLGGTLSGLTTAGLVLANGSDTLTVTANASTFVMPAPVNFGSAYALTVQTQPTGLTCSFSTGGSADASSGTMPAGNVTNVALVCSPQAYALGGTVTGLTSGSLTLTAGGSNTLNVTSNGAFQLPTAVAYGSTYTVTAQTQPTGLTCTVGNATNTMPASAVTNVTVTCAVSTYSIGGTVASLTTTGLVLQDNGTDNTPVAANALQFSMPTAVAYGGTYDITILQQPSGQICSVTNGSGTATAPVTGVQVSCLYQVVFNTPGATTWQIPAGVTSINIVTTGAGGGGSTGTTAGWGSYGGQGAVVTTSLSVTPGDTLTIDVGGGGTGGASGDGISGGGGGSSGINAGTPDQIVAGGGGGGGAVDVDYGGLGGGQGNGGTPNAVSRTWNSCTAQGGSGGNSGTAQSGATNGGNGNGGQGGNGSSGAAGGVGTGTGTGGTGAATCGSASGGGGGGGYGGGAGGNGSGGAGGGSIGPAGSTYSLGGNAGSGAGMNGAAAGNGGNGSIVISYP